MEATHRQNGCSDPRNSAERSHSPRSKQKIGTRQLAYVMCSRHHLGNTEWRMRAPNGCLQLADEVMAAIDCLELC